MKKNFDKKGGISILGIIIIVIIVILFLSYFKISIRSVVESPESKDNFGYINEKTQTVWQKYLKKPANYLWNDVFIEIFWNSFINNMERIRDGKPTDFELYAPIIPLNNPLYFDKNIKSNK